MFSVVIPLYNKELSIRNTLQSVLDQTFTDFEILIVNDGSTDSSAAVVEEFTDSRIRLIHQENQGVSAARNRGIQEAKNDWIAFLDGDDLWLNSHLKIFSIMINKYPNDGVFCSSYINSNQEIPNKNAHFISVIDNYFIEAINHYPIWTSAVCIKKEVLRNVGEFNPTISRGEDRELWGRIGRKFRIIKSNMVTSIYRIEAENRSDQYFELKTSIAYQYDFASATSKEEVEYHKKYTIKTFRYILKKRKLFDFLQLYWNKRKYISLREILFKNI